MTQKELKESMNQFDLTSFFMKDTQRIHDYSAILVITDNQVIITENGHHGKDFHIDTLADICKIIYQIPISKSKSDWTNSVVQIEKKYASNFIWARLLNEGNSRLFWFIFPSSITQQQYDLLSNWIESEDVCLKMEEIEEQTEQSIVGFLGLNGMEKGIDAVLNYASTITELTQTTPQVEKIIIGKTIGDLSKKIKIRGIKK